MKSLFSGHNFSLSSIFYFLSSIFFFLSSFFISGCVTTEYGIGSRSQDIYFISASREIAMGRNLHRQVSRQFELSNNPHDIRRIQRIAEKLVEVSDRRELNYYFYVIDNEDKKEEIINAFSLPGGYIYIFKDLFDILDDDELAFVLAHEMAHIVCRHHIKRLQAAMGYNLLLIGSAAAPSDADFTRGLSFALDQIFMAHSRLDEFEADELAAKYAQAAGFDAKAGVRVLETLYAKSREKIRPLSYFRTHPYPAQRISRIRRHLRLPLSPEDYIHY